MMDQEEKTINEQKSSSWNQLQEEEQQEIFAFSQAYIQFLNEAKTEREAVNVIREMAEAAGFQNLEDLKTLQPGDRVYAVNREKSMCLAVIGEQNLEEGVRMIGAHIDSPRLDLKQIPLYEDENLALFKTHYYGGIKKYQWTTIPLALHGVVVKTSGEKVNIKIGEAADDPIFTITDLLPHLATQQNKKTLSAGIAGEDLNVLIGSLPQKDTEKEAVKKGI